MMDKPRKRISISDALFCAAVLVCTLGAGLLLVTTGVVDRGFSLWPLALTAVGIVLAYTVIAFRLRTPLYFLGILAGFVGLVLALKNASAWTLGMTWPLFMVAVGVTIMLSGLRRYRRPRIVFVAPAAIFVSLGGFFALFSFKAITVSFKSFVSVWWPLLFILAGVSLFALYAVNKIRFPRNRSHTRNGRRR